MVLGPMGSCSVFSILYHFRVDSSKCGFQGAAWVSSKGVILFAGVGDSRNQHVGLGMRMAIQMGEIAASS